MRAGAVVGVIIGVVFVIIVIMAFIIACSRKRVITNRERERDHLVGKPPKYRDSTICANRPIVDYFPHTVCKLKFGTNPFRRMKYCLLILGNVGIMAWGQYRYVDPDQRRWTTSPIHWRGRKSRPTRSINCLRVLGAATYVRCGDSAETLWGTCPGEMEISGPHRILFGRGFNSQVPLVLPIFLLENLWN